MRDDTKRTTVHTSFYLGENGGQLFVVQLRVTDDATQLSFENSCRRLPESSKMGSTFGNKVPSDSLRTVKVGHRFMGGLLLQEVE